MVLFAFKDSGTSPTAMNRFNKTLTSARGTFVRSLNVVPSGPGAEDGGWSRIGRSSSAEIGCQMSRYRFCGQGSESGQDRCENFCFQNANISSGSSLSVCVDPSLMCFQSDRLFFRQRF